MKITSKGQLTIPQKLREQFGFHPSMEVEFQACEDGVKIVHSSARGGRGKALVEHMRGRGQKRIRADDLMRMTRGEE